MTRIFTDEGLSVPVTVVEVVPNRVTQIKKINSDGYNSLQLTFGKAKASKLNKSQTGHYSKVSVEAGLGLHELRLSEDDISNYKTDSQISIEIFKVGQKVDVTGTTIGKGFQGPIKRHHFSSNRATHGVSISHNSHGSTGQCQDPGRVFPGKKMAGHLGDKKRTTQNLEVIRIDSLRNLILIKGSVPGSKGSDVLIKYAVKSEVNA
jgi:large subunit ribosomal protein L3